MVSIIIQCQQILSQQMSLGASWASLQRQIKCERREKCTYHREEWHTWHDVRCTWQKNTYQFWNIIYFVCCPSSIELKLRYIVHRRIQRRLERGYNVRQCIDRVRNRFLETLKLFGPREKKRREEEEGNGKPSSSWKIHSFTTTNGRLSKILFGIGFYIPTISRLHKSICLCALRTYINIPIRATSTVCTFSLFQINFRTRKQYKHTAASTCTLRRRPATSNPFDTKKKSVTVAECAHTFWSQIDSCHAYVASADE